MDPSQFQTFLEHQTKLFQHLIQSMQLAAQMQQQYQQSLPLDMDQQVSATTRESIPFPLPKPLSFEGSMAENFDFFVQSWKDYSKAIGMDHWPPEYNAIRVSLLLAVVGEPVKNYNLSANELGSPETALETIRAKVVANRNVIADLSGFFTAKQTIQESIDDYAARLKRLAQISQPGTLESGLVTYKIVTTNKWKHLRTKMRTIANISLEKALDMCRAEEKATDRLQELSSSVVQGSKFNKTKHSNKQNQKIDVPGKLAHSAQRRPMADSNKNRNVLTPGPGRSTHQFEYFLNTDYKFTDLCNWISGYVSSEHETPSEFIQSLATALMEYKTNPIDEAWIDDCVKLIFEKVVSEPNCSEGYAKLAVELGIQITVTDSKFISFKRRLLALCQKEFESRCIDRTILGEIENVANDEPKELKAELDLGAQKRQRRVVVAVRFIGELYNHEWMTSSIMCTMINLLIEKDAIEYDEEKLECLCKLLTTIGFKMEKEKQDMTYHFLKMDEIVRHMEQNQMCSKIQFMIQEVIDLRQNGWKVE